VLKRALRALRDEEIATEEGIRWLWLAALAAAFIWDYESYEALTARQIQVARHPRRTHDAPARARHAFGGAPVRRRTPAAASLIEESDALAMATHGRINQYVPLPLAAFRGHEEEVKRLVQSSTKDFVDTGEGMGLTMASGRPPCFPTG